MFCPAVYVTSYIFYGHTQDFNVHDAPAFPVDSVR